MSSSRAQALNATLHRIFDEPSIFRIDHYLGKETVLGGWHSPAC